MLSRFLNFRSRTYDSFRLIDRKQRCAHKSPGKTSAPLDSPQVVVICDIDKTYLETSFDRMIDLAKTALEKPIDKRTVFGAADVLSALRWSLRSPAQDKALYPRPLHFVSSSPPQLRGVLEEKLRLDQLDWTSDTFKNQAYNVWKGKVNLLRQHCAYKVAAIFSLIDAIKDPTQLLLIGDSAELDSFVYMGVALYHSGRLPVDAMVSFLKVGGVENSEAHKICREFKPNPAIQKVSIAIRDVDGYPFIQQPVFTKSIFTFRCYLDLAGYLFLLKLISLQDFMELTRRFRNLYRLDMQSLFRSIQYFLNYLKGDISRTNDVESLEAFILKLTNDYPFLKTVKNGYSLEHVQKFDFSLPDYNSEEWLLFVQDWMERKEKTRLEGSPSSLVKKIN